MGHLGAATYFAAHAIGCVAVPLDFDSPPEAAQQLASASEPRLAITASDLAISTPTVPLLSVCGKAVDGAELVPDCCLDDVADILYTTVTTGNNKGVVLTHGNIAQAAMKHQRLCRRAAW